MLPRSEGLERGPGVPPSLPQPRERGRAVLLGGLQLGVGGEGALQDRRQRVERRWGGRLVEAVQAILEARGNPHHLGEPVGGRADAQPRVEQLGVLIGQEGAGRRDGARARHPGPAPQHLVAHEDRRTLTLDPRRH